MMNKCRMKINEIFTENFIMNDDNVDLFATFLDSEAYPNVADFINSDNDYQLRLDYFLQHSLVWEKLITDQEQLRIVGH